MKTIDDILSYRELCDAENVQTLQRGMNFRLNSKYSVILMSQRSNALYKDTVHTDGKIIEYEGHDKPRRSYIHNPKFEDQSLIYPSGKLTQNGLFAQAVDYTKLGVRPFEVVKVYEKIMDGILSLKGIFNLIDYKIIHDENRKVYRFILELSDNQESFIKQIPFPQSQNRLIPSEIKKEVWIRYQGKSVLCGDTKSLHFDHELPFSKGGTSLSLHNVRILCMKHNLEKSAKLE